MEKEVLILTGVNGSGKSRYLNELFEKSDFEKTFYLANKNSPLFNGTSYITVRCENKGKIILFQDIILSFTHQSQLSVKTSIKNDTIIFSEVSSGLKKIIYVFSEVIFGKCETILIDDVEVNLSIAWQKDFLPKLVSLPFVKKVVVTTHSPFIFKNEFKSFTKDMAD